MYILVLTEVLTIFYCTVFLKNCYRNKEYIYRKIRNHVFTFIISSVMFYVKYFVLIMHESLIMDQKGRNLF